MNTSTNSGVSGWVSRFQRHFKEVALNTLVGGLGVFVFSNILLFGGIHYFPELFINYISPEFNSEGNRNVLFYMHPFVLTHSLAILWNRFQKYFTGNVFKTGTEFGLLYAVVALVPILWITYAAMDVELPMVISWLMYGFLQSAIAGIVFSFIRYRNWV
jgi:hypothetical protein